MDNFTILANKILKENADSEIDALMRKKFNDAYPTDNKPVDPYNEPGAQDLSAAMLRLDDDIFRAIQRGDKENHLKHLHRYEALRDKALQRFGIDGPVGLIDPDLHGSYSDDFKDKHGVRPHSETLNTFRNAVEFYSDGRYGKFEGDEFIAPEVKSYIGDAERHNDPEMNEDQESGIRSLDGFFSDEETHIEDNESGLTPENLKTIETVKKLASGEAKGGLNPFDNPEKAIKKAYGKLLNQVSTKINQIKI
jgi:hypothetical protein